METLRFLMVSTHYPPYHLGGDAVFVRYLADALEYNGHEVHVLCNPNVYRSLRRNSQAIQRERSRSDRIHMISTKSPEIDLANALILGHSTHASTELKTLAGKLRPDVIHWHNTKGMIGRPFEIGAANTVYTAHDYYLVCPRSNLLKPDMTTCQVPEYCQLCNIRWMKPPPLWRMARARAIRLSNDVITIAPSEFTARRLEEDGIRIRFRIRNFVPPPVEIDSVPEREDIILYLGLLEPHKGILTLLDAFHRSCNQHNYSLVLIGEGSLRLELRKRSSRLGIQNRVHLPGFVNDADLATIRRKARIQVVPSEWPENAPLTAIEGLANGTPLLVSNQGGLPEIAEQGEGCEVFTAGDVTALSRIITRLTDDQRALSRMGEGARDMYLSHYTPERHLEAYMKAIRFSGK